MCLAEVPREICRSRTPRYYAPDLKKLLDLVARNECRHAHLDFIVTREELLDSTMHVRRSGMVSRQSKKSSSK